MTARRAAVLGSPIAHSLSPALHRAAYDALGLAGWSYEAYDVDERALPGFVSGLDDTWAGLSLTMPLKAAVLPLLDEASPLVEAVGAANTVLLGPDGRRGENTDVPGMVAALRERGVGDMRTVCLLGGGSTAASALAAATELGVAEVTVHVRNPRRVGSLTAAAGRLGVRLLINAWDAAADAASADLVVATTPAGSTDALAGALPDRVTGTLFDVVYHPWPTPLARAWAERGGRVVGGLDLLVHQAARQVVLMTGTSADVPSLVPVMRAAGEAALARR